MAWRLGYGPAAAKSIARAAARPRPVACHGVSFQLTQVFATTVEITALQQPISDQISRTRAARIRTQRDVRLRDLPQVVPRPERLLGIAQMLLGHRIAPGCPRPTAPTPPGPPFRLPRTSRPRRRRCTLSGRDDTDRRHGSAGSAIRRPCRIRLRRSIPTTTRRRRAISTPGHSFTPCGSTPRGSATRGSAVRAPLWVR